MISIYLCAVNQMHMHKEKLVFAQLVEFLNDDKFRHIVDKHKGNSYVKSFTC